MQGKIVAEQSDFLTIISLVRKLTNVRKYDRLSSADALDDQSGGILGNVLFTTGAHRSTTRIYIIDDIVILNVILQVKIVCC